jgi:hypothetical protein
MMPGARMKLITSFSQVTHFSDLDSLRSSQSSSETNWHKKICPALDVVSKTLLDHDDIRVETAVLMEVRKPTFQRPHTSHTSRRIVAR